MKRALWIVLLGTTLALYGCGWIPPVTPDDRFEAEFTVQVVPPLTVAVEARATRGATAYTWDWGDGSPPLTGGAGVRVARHVYAAAGRYVITLAVLADPSAGGGGDGDGGPGPGPGGPISGSPRIASSHRIVDLHQAALPTPIIRVEDAITGQPGNRFYAGDMLRFRAVQSQANNPWWRWEVVRIDPATGEPIPHAEAAAVEYFRSDQESFLVAIPGPVSCPGAAWTFRVRLWVGDGDGRSAVAETRIQSLCRPSRCPRG